MTVIKKGWGYWDVTHYPRGGCFRRASTNMPVEITGEAARGETPVITADGTRIVVTTRALQEV
jgi:hypothetical protein